MISKPWAVVFGWGMLNMVLWSIMFAFDSPLWPEMLYVASALPLTIFGIAVWYSDHVSHSGVRAIGDDTGTAAILAGGFALIGVGGIFARWIWLLGIFVVVVAGYQMLRSGPEKLHAPPEELARLPIRTLADPPDDKTDVDSSEQPGSAPKHPAERAHAADGAHGPVVVTATAVAGAAAGVRRAWKNRGRS